MAAHRPTWVPFQEREHEQAWRDHLDGWWSLNARSEGQTRPLPKERHRGGSPWLHRGVKTTMMYMHVLNRGPGGIRSPLDGL